MYWLIFLFALALSSLTSASAKNADESYYCVAEASGGIFYNEGSKSWRGTVFNPNDKFVLNVKKVDEKQQGIDLLETLIVTITPSGSNYAAPCLDFGSVSSDPTILVKYQIIMCTANATQYLFSRTNNRYLSTYPIGYINGQDNNENTPSVTGGICTKIK